MTLAPLSLLGLLAGGVRAARPPLPAGADSPDFADLLARAQRGELSSGRDVATARGLGVTLDKVQKGQIAAAADRAEAAGAQQLLVLIDGMALRVDVASRTVVERLDLASAGVSTGVDAVVSLPGKSGADGPRATALAPPPGGGGTNPSLLKALAASEK